MRPKALTAYYDYPGHWIHFNAAQVYSAQFPLPGEHSLPGKAACDNGAGKFKHNHLSHHTWSHFLHLGQEQQCSKIALLKDKSAWRWRDSNLGSPRESQVNTPIYHNTSGTEVIFTPI